MASSLLCGLVRVLASWLYLRERSETRGLLVCLYWDSLLEGFRSALSSSILLDFLNRWLELGGLSEGHRGKVRSVGLCLYTRCSDSLRLYV